MNIKKNVLITGATSRAVQPLVPRIDRTKFNVHVTSRKQRVEPGQVTLHTGDLTDPAFCRSVVRDMDIVIHAAGLTHSTEADDYYKVNYGITKTLADAVNKDARFVYISSRVAVKNSGAYGESKLKAEEYIQNRLDNYLIIRPAEIFGTGGEGIDEFLETVARKKVILAPGGLKDKMYPLHIDDFTNLLYRSVFVEQGRRQPVVTINGAEGYTYVELVKAISERFDLRRIIIPVPKPVMYMIAGITGWLKIKMMGVVSDQIPRLYCRKTHQSWDYDFKSVLTCFKENYQK